MLTKTTTITTNLNRTELAHALQNTLHMTSQHAQSIVGTTITSDENANVTLTPTQAEKLTTRFTESNTPHSVYSHWSDDQFPYGRTRCKCGKFAVENINGTDTCHQCAE